MLNHNATSYQHAYTNFARISPLTPPHSAEKIPSHQMMAVNEENYQQVDELTGKRNRTAFTEAQITEMEREFKRCIFLHQQRRIDISNRLGLNEKQVKIWFQNRRMKMKKSSIIPNGNKIVKPTKGQHKIVKRLLKNTSNTENICPNVLPPTGSTQVRIQNKVEIQSVVTIKGTSSLPVIKPLAAELVPNAALSQNRKFNPQLLLQVPQQLPKTIQIQKQQTQQINTVIASTPFLSQQHRQQPIQMPTQPHSYYNPNSPQPEPNTDFGYQTLLQEPSFMQYIGQQTYGIQHQVPQQCHIPASSPTFQQQQHHNQQFYQQVNQQPQLNQNQNQQFIQHAHHVYEQPQQQYHTKQNQFKQHKQPYQLQQYVNRSEEIAHQNPVHYHHQIMQNQHACQEVSPSFNYESSLPKIQEQLPVYDKNFKELVVSLDDEFIQQSQLQEDVTTLYEDATVAESVDESVDMNKFFKFKKPKDMSEDQRPKCETPNELSKPMEHSIDFDVLDFLKEDNSNLQPMCSLEEFDLSYVKHEAPSLPENAEESVDINKFFKLNTTPSKNEDQSLKSATQQPMELSTDFDVSTFLNIVETNNPEANPKSHKDEFDIKEFVDSFDKFVDQTNATNNLTLNETVIEENFHLDLKDLEIDALLNFSDNNVMDLSFLSESKPPTPKPTPTPTVSISFEDIKNPAFVPTMKISF